MKIGTTHRNKIWKGLIEYKNSVNCLIPESLQHESSSASVVSLNSQSSISQSSNYCPGYYEVTRYTFKHTVSLTRETKRPRTDDWFPWCSYTTIQCCITNRVPPIIWVRIGRNIIAYLICKTKRVLEIGFVNDHFYFTVYRSQEELLSKQCMFWCHLFNLWNCRVNPQTEFFCWWFFFYVYIYVLNRISFWTRVQTL
jgi:hypothetical protein